METLDNEKKLEFMIKNNLKSFSVTDQALNKAIKSIHFSIRCSELEAKKRTPLCHYNIAVAFGLIVGLALGIGVLGLLLIVCPYRLSEISKNISSEFNLKKNSQVSEAMISIPIDQSKQIIREIELFKKTISSYSSSAQHQTDSTNLIINKNNNDALINEFRNFACRISSLISTQVTKKTQ